MLNLLCSQNRRNRRYTTPCRYRALRKNVSGVMTSSNEYLSTPSDFLYVYSLAVVDGSGNFTFLLNKDVNFIREAYPSSSSTGTPKHYALFDNDTILLGPTPNSGFNAASLWVLPQSIVVAGTTWLGEEFDSALLKRHFSRGHTLYEG